MTVLRNVEVTTDSFQEFLETFQADKVGRNTIISLHLHNVSFASMNSNNYKRRRNEMMADNLFTPLQLSEVSIDLCCLDVQAGQVMGPILGAILHSNNTVRTLKIANSKISVEFVDLLKSMFEQRRCFFKNIHLQNIHMEEVYKMNELLLALHNGSDIHVLHLEKCGLGTAQISHLAGLIRAQQNLISLDISKNNLDGTSLCFLLERGIAQHPTLSKLMLSENPIGDKGAVALSKFLSSTDHSNLRSLSLLECEIWDRGCRAMARDMARFGNLKELFVDGNWGEHLESIAKSLRNNVVMTKLWMPQYFSGSNDCEDTQRKAWTQIQYYLRLNRANRKILLNVSISSSTWVSTLARGNTDLDLIFYVLRSRPEVASFKRLDENDGTLVCG
jgi:Leucine-rich repeat (LRR) protein